MAELPTLPSPTRDAIFAASPLQRCLRDVHVATVMPWATDTPFDRHAANHSGHSVQLPLPDTAAKAIPGATLVEFADLGHSPQVEAPERFNKALLDALAKGPVD